jgi:hypothetical protein
MDGNDEFRLLSARRTIAHSAEMESPGGGWRTAKSAGFAAPWEALHDLPPCRI